MLPPFAKHITIDVLLLLVVALVLAAPLAAQTDPDFEDALVLEGEGVSVEGVVEENQQLQTVTREQIEQTLAPDVPALLERTLGVTVQRNGGYGNVAGVSLRGLGSGRVALLIDGVPVNSAQTGSFDLSRLPVGSLERIEVVSGGSDTKFNVNGAIGGVINLVTVQRPPAGTQFQASVSNLAYYPGRLGVSPLDTQSASALLSWSDDQTSWTLGLTGNHAANNYLYQDQGQTLWWTGNGMLDAGVSSTLSLALPGDMRLRLSGSGNYASRHVPGPMGSTTPGRQIEAATLTSVNFAAATVGLDTLSTELVVSHRFDSIDWTDPATHATHRLNTWGAIHRWEWAVYDSLTLRTGLDGELSLVDSTSVGSFTDVSAGAWLTAKVTLGSEVEVVPSVKTVMARDQAEPIVVPKLGVVWHPQPTLSLKNNYFRAYKLPAINDRYWPEDSFAVGNPSLKPEDGWGADLIASGVVPGVLAFESSLHGTWLRDAILWQPSNGKWRPENVGQAFYTGVDQTVKSEFHDVVQLTASYSFLLTYVLSGGFTWADDKRMPYRPVHTFGLGVTFDWKSGSLSLNEHYESGRYISTLNVTELAPFFTADLQYRQKLDQNWSGFVSVKNAFNQTYFSLDGYPMPGGSVTAGLDYQWGP